MISRTSCAEGSAGSGCPASAASISRKIHGRPCAPRPTITPATPVARTTSTAWAAFTMSPFAKTGIDTASRIAAIVAYSATPPKRQARVRPCTASAAMPAASAIRAIATPLRCSGLQPVRIFSVTGTAAARTVASRIEPTRDSSRSSAEPASLLQTFFAGQPMLMSMTCAPASTLRLAASARQRGSPPAICTTLGSGSSVWSRRRRDSAVSHSRGSAEIISPAASAAPRRRHSRRNGRSVTPAIGASTARPCSTYGPIVITLPQPGPRAQRSTFDDSGRHASSW